MDKLTLAVECAQLPAPMVVLLYGATTRRYHPDCAERAHWFERFSHEGVVEVENACSWHYCDHCRKRFS